MPIVLDILLASDVQTNTLLRLKEPGTLSTLMHRCAKLQQKLEEANIGLTHSKGFRSLVFWIDSIVLSRRFSLNKKLIRRLLITDLGVLLQTDPREILVGQPTARHGEVFVPIVDDAKAMHALQNFLTTDGSGVGLAVVHTQNHFFRGADHHILEYIGI